MILTVFIGCFSSVGLLSAMTPAQIPASADPAAAKPVPSPTPTPILTTGKRERQFFKNVLRDQKAIWTSPFRLQGKDSHWLAPFGALTAALVATDRFTSRLVEPGGKLAPVSKHVSWGGTIYVAGGISAAFYFAGYASHNARARETGILSAQALLDSGIVVGAIKHLTQRPRPDSSDGRGRFFQGSRAFMSFPSGHSASAWAVASVVGHEYNDKPKIRYIAYAAAMAVSIARFTGRTHFISEVLVGSAIGFYTGRYVYRTYHFSKTDPKGKTMPQPAQTTKLMPSIIPLYDARTVHTADEPSGAFKSRIGTNFSKLIF